MYTWIMQMILTMLLSLINITPAWCDSCGEIYEASELHIGCWTDHDGIGHESAICDDCWLYWDAD